MEAVSRWQNWLKESTEIEFIVDSKLNLNAFVKWIAHLRQKNTFSSNQTQRLVQEKLDLEVQLKEKENFINQMKDRVGEDLMPVRLQLDGHVCSWR